MAMAQLLNDRSLLLLVVLPNLRLADRLEQPLDDVVVADSLGLRLKIGADAMPEHGDGDLLDVVDGDAVSAVHRRDRLGALYQVDSGARASAPVDHALDEIGGQRVLRPGRASQPNGVFLDVIASRHR